MIHTRLHSTTLLICYCPPNPIDVRQCLLCNSIPGTYHTLSRRQCTRPTTMVIIDNPPLNVDPTPDSSSTTMLSDEFFASALAHAGCKRGRSTLPPEPTAHSQPPSCAWSRRLLTLSTITILLRLDVASAFTTRLCSRPPQFKSCLHNSNGTNQRSTKFHQLNLFNFNRDSSSSSSPAPPGSTTTTATEIEQIEKEVIASSRAQLDRVALERSLSTTTPATCSDDLNIQNTDPQTKAVMASPWKVARAAATSASIFVLIISGGDKILTALTFIVVFLWANSDPLDEEDESVAGPIARLLGRQSIAAIETTKPKLKAVAKAAITDVSEQNSIISNLQRRVEQLEAENDELKAWKQRRVWVDSSQSNYTLDELKEIARRNNLRVGGAKAELMMRLLENGVDLGMESY